MFKCFFCDDEFEDDEMCFSVGDGAECCPGCENEDADDEIYFCHFCGDSVSLSDLEYDEDGNECHSDCLAEYDKENS